MTGWEIYRMPDFKMDNALFEALADEHRRELLDLLHSSSGVSLSDLSGELDIPKAAVIKHLKLLEEAGLLTTQRVGRQKLHYFAAEPFRSIQRRWAADTPASSPGGLQELREALRKERAAAQTGHPPLVVLIRAEPEQIWQALTDPLCTARYWCGCGFEASAEEAGATCRLLSPGGAPLGQGIIETWEPAVRLGYTWTAAGREGKPEGAPARICWEIGGEDAMPGVSRLTLTCGQSPGGAAEPYSGMGGPWPVILSGMKTLLETGEPLFAPGSQEPGPM